MSSGIGVVIAIASRIARYGERPCHRSSAARYTAGVSRGVSTRGLSSVEKVMGNPVRDDAMNRLDVSGRDRD
jgi:hypothetical protein